MPFRWLRDPWHLATDIGGGPVGFCLWALQRDGLRVAPYDRHPDGDGALRALGMDAATWRVWYEGTIRRAANAAETLRVGDQPVFARAERDALLAAFQPHLAWPGEPAVAAELARLHPQYERDRDRWERPMQGPGSPLWHSPRAGRAWWRELSAAHGSLPPARVYLVDYPATIIAPHPPESVVIAMPLAALDWPAYARQTVEGVRRLAAA